jgi:replication factor C subunit 3/5
MDIDTSFIPWVEKYRPNKIENIILEDNNKNFIYNMLDKKIYPNLLLYGPPGTGKTTTIINIINSIYPNDINKSIILHLNASDERGIEMIRSQIHKFISSKPLFSNKIKFVILDEVDYMTKSAQTALKYLLQQYNTNSLVFYLMCNYISKIDESLKNEFIELKFYKSSSESINEFLLNIAAKEKLNISNDSIKQIQEYFVSDIRSMINYLQLNFNKNSDIKILTNSRIDELYIYIKNNTIEYIEKYLIKMQIDYNINNRTIIIAIIKYLIHKNIINYDNELFNKFEAIVHDKTNNCLSNKYFITIIKAVLS